MSGRKQPLTRAERRRLERAERARSEPRARPARKRSPWRSPTAIVTGLALIAAAVAIVLLGQRGVPPGDTGTAGLVIPTSSYPASIVEGGRLGRPDAPVTLDIWSDFQCPFCGELARTYLPRLVSDFVVSGQLQIAARDVDFVGRGEPNESVESAVAAACAADQGKYWQYHDLLFWNQKGENEGAFDAERLEAMADELGLDRGSWDGCRADPRRAESVAATTSAALAAGINSTPTLVLNGTVTVGLPRTYEYLANAVRALLPAAGSTRSAATALPAP